MKKILMLLTISMLLTGCGQEATSKREQAEEMSIQEFEETNLTAHQKAWIEDINGTIRSCLASSAGITESMTDEEREKRLDILVEKIQTEHWSDGKIIYYLRNLISDFKIGHMGLSCRGEYRADSVVYPIVGEWFGEDFYITAALPAYESYLGYRLTEIEGIPLKRVLEMYDERVSNETYSYLKNCFEQYNDQGFIKSDLEYSGIKDN